MLHRKQQDSWGHQQKVNTTSLARIMLHHVSLGLLVMRQRTYTAKSFVSVVAVCGSCKAGIQLERSKRKARGNLLISEPSSKPNSPKVAPRRKAWAKCSVP